MLIVHSFLISKIQLKKKDLNNLPQQNKQQDFQLQLMTFLIIFDQCFFKKCLYLFEMNLK